MLHSRLAKFPYVVEQMTAIAGMCVGWATGDAVVKLFTDLGTVAQAGSTGNDAPPITVKLSSAASSPSATPAGTRRLADALTLSPSHDFDMMLFALGYTGLCAALIIVLQLAFTRGCPCRFGGAVLDAIEEVLYCFWGLATRALTTSVLMLWNHISSVGLLSGLSAEQHDGPLHRRLLLLWAGFLTLAGAAVTVKLLQWRDRLIAVQMSQDQQYAAAVTAVSAIASTGGGSTEEQARLKWEAHLTQLSATPQANAAAETQGAPDAAEEQSRLKWAAHLNDLEATDRASRSSRAFYTDATESGQAAYPNAPTSTNLKPQLRSQATVQLFVPPQAAVSIWNRLSLSSRQTICESGRQLLLLSEKVISWITGCAWTNVVFATQARPSVWLVLKDSAVACVLTFVTVVWLIVLGGQLQLSTQSDRLDRSVVESYFVCNSASFFVGWSWVVVLRDLAAVSGQLAMPKATSAGLMALLGLEDLADAQRASTSSFMGALVGVTCFGPLLSVVVIWTKQRLLLAYGRVGLPSTRRFLLDLLVRGAEEEEGSDLSTKLGRRFRAQREQQRDDLQKEVEKDSLL